MTDAWYLCTHCGWAGTNPERIVMGDDGPLWSCPRCPYAIYCVGNPDEEPS